MKSDKRLWIVIILAALLLAVWSVVGAQNAPAFKIGILDDPSGPIARGALLAVNEINSLGGVQGADGTFFQLELIIQPAADSTSLQTAAANLSQAAVIAVLGPASNTLVFNNPQTLQALGVPVFITATGDTLLTSDTSGRLFRARAAEVLRGRALANVLVNDLGLRRIATVQFGLDIDTTAGVIGFSEAAAALGVSPQLTLQVQGEQNRTDVISRLTQASPEITIIYGDPALVGAFFADLRAAGYTGLLSYNQTEDPAFRALVTTELLANTLSTTTWAFTSTDLVSAAFRERFIFTFGALPGAVEAASYDAIKLLAAAIRRPGELLANLTQLDDIQGVQGILRPAQLTRGETSNNTAVIQYGLFGAPQVVARFAGRDRIAVDEAPVIGTPAPTAAGPTPTPQGVVATITRTIQNVRSGPGMQYDIIGQFQQGQQIEVIGANLDFSWLVVSFRGQNGWLSRSILDTFGDLNTLPIIAPPPTPTAPPSPTAAPIPDLVIDSAVGAPSPFIVGQPFTVSIVVRNAGGAAAGQFAVAATFPPNGVYAAAIVPGLAPGQSTVVNLTGTFTNTGFYSVVLVADLNNEVAESNEQNNVFTFSYAINKPIIRQATQTLNPGDTLDLEGNAVQGDLNWDIGQTALNALFTAKVAVIPNVSLNTIHWDLLSPATITGTSIPTASLVPGTVIGVITADGNRGAVRVDGLNAGQLTVTFLVYSN